MPVLQPLCLELDCLSQMQTNKANSTNWLDVWAKLLYGFNGRWWWWWTRSKQSRAHRLFGWTLHELIGLHFITAERSISLQLDGRKSIVIVHKYEGCRAAVSFIKVHGHHNRKRCSSSTIPSVNAEARQNNVMDLV